MPAARLAAGLIAGGAVLALIAQFIIARSLPEIGTALSAAWRMMGYFTVLTNVIIAAHFLRMALGWKTSARTSGGSTLDPWCRHPLSLASGKALGTGWPCVVGQSGFAYRNPTADWLVVAG